MVSATALAASVAGVPHEDKVDLDPHELGRELGEALRLEIGDRYLTVKPRPSWLSARAPYLAEALRSAWHASSLRLPVL